MKERRRAREGGKKEKKKKERETERVQLLDSVNTGHNFCANMSARAQLLCQQIYRITPNFPEHCLLRTRI